MKAIKKIIALIVALLIMSTTISFGIAGLSANAADELATNGQCGDNAFWNFEKSTGMLVISGKGFMWNYDNYLELFSPFYNCFSIKTVIIESGVESIGDYAFYNCKFLKDVIIADSVTSYGNYCFAECSSLNEFTVSKYVNQIGYRVFYNCLSLEKLNYNAIDATISDEWLGVCYYDDIVYCPSLNTIKIGDCVRSIPPAFVMGCKELTEISLPRSVESIGNAAFAECIGLKDIYIPENVLYIDVYAFHGCLNLEKIVVSPLNAVYDSRNSCNAIIETKFNKLIIGCANSKFDDSITIIGDDAFFGCQKLESIILPQNLHYIESGAFSLCENLKNITIYSDLWYIDSYAFSGCNNLTDIYYYGKKSEWVEIFNAEENDEIKNATVHFGQDSDSKISLSNIEDVIIKYKSKITLKPIVEEINDVNYSISYLSSNSNVATVDNNGNITATGRGTATITCTVTDEYGNVVKDTCTVTVKFQWWQWIIWILLLGFLWY